MTSNILSRIVSIVFYIIIAVSAALGILYYAGGISPETQDAVYVEYVYTQPFLIWAYILFGLAAFFAAGFPLVKAIINPKSAKKAVVPILGILAIVAIAYSLASDEIMSIVGYDGQDNVPSTLKYAGTMIITTYFLAGLAVLSIIFSEVAGLFK